MLVLTSLHILAEFPKDAFHYKRVLQFKRLQWGVSGSSSLFHLTFKHTHHLVVICFLEQLQACTIVARLQSINELIYANICCSVGISKVLPPPIGSVKVCVFFRYAWNLKWHVKGFFIWWVGNALNGYFTLILKCIHYLVTTITIKRRDFYNWCFKKTPELDKKHILKEILECYILLFIESPLFGAPLRRTAWRY